MGVDRTRATEYSCMPSANPVSEVRRCFRREQLVRQFLEFSKGITGREGLGIMLDGPSRCCAAGISVVEADSRDRAIICVSPGDAVTTHRDSAAGVYDEELIETLCTSYTKEMPSVLLLDPLPLGKGAAAAQLLARSCSPSA